MTVRDIVAKMILWTESGYLDRGVWTQLAQKINEAALPDNIETLRLPAPAMYQYASTASSGGPYPVQPPALTAGPYPLHALQLPPTASNVHTIQQTSKVR